MSAPYPATERCLGLPAYVYGWIILIVALAFFFYILYRRYELIRLGQSDPRLTSVANRFRDLIYFGFIQKRQPRYFWAGLLHIMIFWGFIVLGLRSLDLVTQALSIPILRGLMATTFGVFYGSLKDLFELIVLVACIWAILRRAIIKPERYKGSHSFEAYLVLGLISFLMITDMFFEGSMLLLGQSEEGWLPAASLTLPLLNGFSKEPLKAVYHLSYWLHLLTFFFFLNFLPLGKHFHIITALPNVFFRKLSKGSIKPARWGVKDIEELETLGVEKLEDFTWKHILDLFTCTECGRCSDNCPADMVKRPLSPKMITIKLRDYAYDRFPVFKRKRNEEDKEKRRVLVGDLITDDEIWSCTTCGACEEECPVFIEYIDKIIDMRRHLIETSRNPQTFNRTFMNFEKTGNPFGKPPAKRTEWVKELLKEIPVKILKEGDEVDVLYFVDSYASYDPRVQAIAAAIVKGLHRANVDFGLLGPLEKDSGHQVRRMGEEGLFQVLVEENMETFKNIRFKQIVTTDPHAYNTLKKDYPASLDVYHYSQFFLTLVEQGRLRAEKGVENGPVVVYHDPCYLGRHNEIYDEPRKLLRTIPGLKLVEMKRSRDKSFCCGGGDIILWHEIEQEQIRMADKRIQMAREAGANVIVTACPFCLIHFEDAIKTGGLEEQIKVVDLMELFVSTL